MNKNRQILKKTDFAPNYSKGVRGKNLLLLAERGRSYSLQTYNISYPMQTVKIDYTGDLGTTCTHIKSGTEIKTDAPVDNNGKGESFSPTDLVAAAYGSCMLTIIGIYCDQNDLKFVNGNCSVVKNMEASPRRIGGLEIIMDLRGNDWDDNQKKRVKNAAMACPVAKSVSPEMNIEFKIEF